MRPNITTPRTLRGALPAPFALIGTLAAALAPVSGFAESAPAHSATSRIAAVPGSSTPATYTVRSGDTISSIAARFGLRTVDVLRWNGLEWSTVIHPGQIVRLTAQAQVAPSTPAPVTTGARTHTVARGDTVYAIARKHGSTTDAILRANGIGPSAIIYLGQRLTIPGAAAASPSSTVPSATPTPSPAPTNARTHTVTRGDTVYAIARKHGSTTDAILRANGIGPSAIIYPGQTLTIPGTTTAPAAAPAATAPPQRSASLNAAQIENATMIIQIGRELGVPDRGIAIALATAMVESTMRNLDYGDRDSLGLFQQRPSTGWGTPAQIMDRDRSIRAFYGGPGDPNGTKTRGLLDISGWESMAFTVAAQRVQISAFPDRYGQWETQAYQWLAQHG